MMPAKNSGYSDPLITGKRRKWRKVPLAEKLRLEAAVNFGLPVNFAGKVIGIESSNTDRILHELR